MDEIAATDDLGVVFVAVLARAVRERDGGIALVTAETLDLRVLAFELVGRAIVVELRDRPTPRVAVAVLAGVATEVRPIPSSISSISLSIMRDPLWSRSHCGRNRPQA